MFLEHEGMKYHPDAIILAFAANDLEDNVKSGIYHFDKLNLVPMKSYYAPGAKAVIH